MEPTTHAIFGSKDLLITRSSVVIRFLIFFQLRLKNFNTCSLFVALKLKPMPKYCSDTRSIVPIQDGPGYMMLTLIEVVGLPDVDQDQGHELQLGQALPGRRWQGQQVP